MRTLIILLCSLAAGNITGQTELNVTGSIGYLLSPSTASRGSGADRNDEPFELTATIGLEAIFVGEGTRAPVFTRLTYGTFTVDRLTNDFTGVGAQGGAIDARTGQLVGQARLQGGNYLQGAFGLGLISPEQSNGFNLELAFGATLILRERVHAVTTWVDPETGIAEPAGGGWFSDAEGVIIQDFSRPNPPAAGHLILSRSMLNQVTPFAELSTTFRNWRGFSSSVAVQAGLTPFYDKSWYNTETRNNWWLVVSASFRGRLL